jgi:hypothetical protein
MNVGGAKWRDISHKTADKPTETLAEKQANKLTAGALLYSDTRVYLVESCKRAGLASRWNWNGEFS